jgi:hypothetical protein
MNPQTAWDIAEDWCHELITKERDTYLDTDYELAQLQLQLDFMECIDIAD